MHTVLVDMRARLRNSARPDRIFEAALEVAKEAGLIGRKRVLDSTALYDAVATQDTVTMIRASIRGLLRVADKGLTAELRAVLKRDDDYATAGKPACDWEVPLDEAEGRAQVWASDVSSTWRQTGTRTRLRPGAPGLRATRRSHQPQAPRNARDSVHGGRLGLLRRQAARDRAAVRKSRCGTWWEVSPGSTVQHGERLRFRGRSLPPSAVGDSSRLRRSPLTPTT